MFNEFADKLNIKLVLWPNNLVFSFFKEYLHRKNI